MPSHHEGVLDSRDFENGQLEDSEKLTSEPSLPLEWTVASLLRLTRLTLTRTRSTLWPRSLAQPEKLRRTAYLDGLRGFAALLVCWHHNELWAHDSTKQSTVLEAGYGFEQKYHFATLPGVRTFFAGGHFAVATFFIISGYVLSAKPMSLIQAGEHLKLGENVASALFRRWLRLYIPIICTTFVYMCTWHIFGGLWVDFVTRQDSFLGEVWHWFGEMRRISFFFNTTGDPWTPYNFHLWSIPVEMKGSIGIYTCILAFSKCTKNVRLCCEVALIFYFMYLVDGWYCAMFLMGMLLCDLDLLAGNDELPSILVRLQPAKKIIFYHLFVLGMYLGGVPSYTANVKGLSENPGWYYLSYLKPQAVANFKWFYLFLGSTCLVSSVPQIPWLKRSFETDFCQYLGRISFALYLVHGPVLWTLGERVYTAVGYGRESTLEHLANWANTLLLPKIGPLGLEVSFLVPQLILLPFTLWVATIATKLFDEPAVRFAQALYKAAQGGLAIL